MSLKVILLDEWNRILNLAQENKLFRTGVIINTRKSNLFYDSGTGKTVLLNDDEYRLLSSLFSVNYNIQTTLAIFNSTNEYALNNFLQNCLDLKLFRMPNISEFKYTFKNNIRKLINEQLEQIVLEVTEKCNFRCKYCIYDESVTCNRDFGYKDMNWDIAKKAIDYALLHSSDNLAITYYGGEPLLNFDIVKKSTDYALKHGANKNLTFNLTTNLSLMTEEIAKYIASIPCFTITASIDGPEVYHDAMRVYANQKPTFSDSLKGLKLIGKELTNANKNLTISSVLTPEYSYEKLDKINDFFEKLDFLPDKTAITITYPSYDTYNTNISLDKIIDNPRYWAFGIFNPLAKWQLEKAIENSLSWENTKNLYSRQLITTLTQFHTRYSSDLPTLKSKSIHACCIPGYRKIYVKTNGEFMVCERIGNSPNIGNVETGINFELIQKHYIDDYINLSKNQCKDCWAFNVCPSCYASRFDCNGIKLENNDEYCNMLRESEYFIISTYFTILEENPKALEFVYQTTLY